MNRNHLSCTLLVALLTTLLPAAHSNAAATDMPTEKSQPVWDCTGRTPRVKHAQYSDIRYLIDNPLETASQAQDVSEAEPYESPLFALAQKTDDAAISTYLTDEFRLWDADVRLEQAEQIQLLTTPVETKNFNESQHHSHMFWWGKKTQLNWLEKECANNQWNPRNYRKIYAFLSNERFARILDHSLDYHLANDSQDKYLCSVVLEQLREAVRDSHDDYSDKITLLNTHADQVLMEKLLSMGMGIHLNTHDQKNYAQCCDDLEFISKRIQASGITHPNLRKRLINQWYSTQAFKKLYTAIEQGDVNQLANLLDNAAFTNQLTATHIEWLYRKISALPQLTACLLNSPFFATLPPYINDCTILSEALWHARSETVRTILADPQFPVEAINDRCSSYYAISALFNRSVTNIRHLACFNELLQSDRVRLDRIVNKGNNLFHLVALSQTPNATRQAITALLALPPERLPHHLIDAPNDRGASPLTRLILRYPAWEDLEQAAAGFLGMEQITAPPSTAIMDLA